jgi:hypothetical protein
VIVGWFQARELLMLNRGWLFLVGAALLSACTPKAEPEKIDLSKLAVTAELFDDFNYTNTTAMRKNGWIFRSVVGWPGIEGAGWGEQQFSLIADPDRAENRLLRMSAQTNGTGAGTKQAQLCHARKYFTGTYAARVYFSDVPVAGPDGDQVVQTFYTIGPLGRDLDPSYSELDNEYLPNGGWGARKTTLFNTSWETVQIQPWQQFNQSDSIFGSLSGWHVLVMQVANGQVKYFLDGKLNATHGGKNYPKVSMSINFNLWFTREGLIAGSETRVWQQDVDWVFFVQDKLVAPLDVERRIEGFRLLKIAQRDTVLPQSLALSSECNM